MLRWVSLGTLASTVASCHAAAFASAVGIAARAPAACSAPELVLSRSSSAAICASPNRPAQRGDDQPPQLCVDSQPLGNLLVGKPATDEVEGLVAAGDADQGLGNDQLGVGTGLRITQ